MKAKDLKKYSLPDKPGVYFFKKGVDILYIGKATSLKSRVRSYFSSDLIQTRGPIITDMIFKANKVEWQETDSVLEALILEANLIKKYQPTANTKEKDDKSFNYVCISKDELPKIITVRGKNLVATKYKEVYGPFVNGNQLREALKIIRKIFPFLDDKSKNYHEFYKQIHLAPNLDEKNKYLDNIKNIKLLFEGKKKKIVFDLKKEMLALAGEKKFEEASLLKKKIFAITHIYDVALIKEESFTGEEIFRPAPSPEYGAGPSDRKISSPVSLYRIEAYDIAHMSGKNMVGVMTVMENNVVNKDEYRKFRIHMQDAPARIAKQGGNDAGALLEVLERRFTHNEWRYPDLIVVDGNKIQINVANKFLQKNGLNIKVVGVVKDERHKPKGILGDKEIAKNLESQILLVNNEAHRFAITYHKKMRNKNFLPNEKER